MDAPPTLMSPLAHACTKEGNPVYHVEALEAVGEEPKHQVRIVSPRSGLEPWRRVQALVNQMRWHSSF